MSEIKVERLTKRFNETAALDAVSLDFAAGSFTALLGPSGCGKTTMLRLIAGFEAPSQGRVLFGDELMADPQRQVPPEARGVGVVFQSYALWPHMDVAENVAYPLKARHVKRGEIAGRVGAVLDIVGLNGFESRRIEELSGGQRQRVALARCLVADAKIILFDEPLANLDMHLRSSMVDAFRDIHRRTGATIVYVTHDQAEALALADRVAIMSRGKVLQAAAPQEVYRAPANATVAGFVGRGSIVGGTVIDHARQAGCRRLAGLQWLGPVIAERYLRQGGGDSDGYGDGYIRPASIVSSPFEPSGNRICRNWSMIPKVESGFGNDHAQTKR
ncbi:MULTISPECIES: ABC transporter ATP-binding protein [unclassified Mesorhizobium]|uniref:ABC transporter ATP-binding protein n=1 Tax=unclassified Mesorhizobium TaxID=325217 RepID=UPI001FE16BBC|nr:MULTISPECIES: ABC transporter ATP-binding protein [unclassified Mesorhizobium]